jgi:hypothetical protein
VAEAVPAACLAAGAPLAVLPAGVELPAAAAAGEDGVAGLAAAPASGVAGVAAELPALGVDVSAFGAGEAAWVLSAFDFEASLEDPPEQAVPTMARMLNRAT